MLGGHSPSRRIPEYLHDPSADVRAAAIRALAAVDGSATLVEPFVAALDDDVRAVRQAAASVLRERTDPPPEVLGVLMTGSRRAQEAALAALAGHGEAARDRLVDWSAGQVARATDLRRQRSALLASGMRAVDEAPDRSAGFLAFLLGRREWDIETRLLSALAILGAPEAGGLIRRCLRSNDSDTRAQAVEALEFDRRRAPAAGHRGAARRQSDGRSRER